jgi:hypothetical protein
LADGGSDATELYMVLPLHCYPEDTTLPKKPNQAELDAANGAQLDPIIDALLEHLPAPGDYWALDDRKRWLEMMTLAFDMIYDDQPSEVGEQAHGG